MSSAVGSRTTRLVVLRGPSRAGKTTLSMSLRQRPMSVVGQDHLRRIVLKDRDHLELTAAVELIDLTVRFCLDHGKDVVLEGILWSEKYGDMVRRLLTDHRGSNHVYYVRIGLEDSIDRHASSPQADEWTGDDMRSWWCGDDPLGIPDETVLDAKRPQAELLAHITRDLDIPITDWHR